MPDEEIVERVRAGETALYEILMRRYNQRLYRVARSILGNDAEAEDVMQEAYVRAFAHLDQFEGRAKFATWLTKIAAYEALMRLRKRSRFTDLDKPLESGDLTGIDVLPAPGPNPEQQAASSELRGALEAALDSLPDAYRAVFVCREVEGLDTRETAEALGMTVQTVKIRLHRARAHLRKELYRRAGVRGAYGFELTRCNIIVERVFARLAELTA